MVQSCSRTFWLATTTLRFYAYSLMRTNWWRVWKPRFKTNDSCVETNAGSGCEGTNSEVPQKSLRLDRDRRNRDNGPASSTPGLGEPVSLVRNTSGNYSIKQKHPPRRVYSKKCSPRLILHFDFVANWVVKILLLVSRHSMCKKHLSLCSS